MFLSQLTVRCSHQATKRRGIKWAPKHVGGGYERPPDAAGTTLRADCSPLVLSRLDSGLGTVGAGRRLEWRRLRARDAQADPLLPYCGLRGFESVSVASLRQGLESRYSVMNDKMRSRHMVPVRWQGLRGITMVKITVLSPGNVDISLCY